MLFAAKKLCRDMTPEERQLWNEVRNNRSDGLHFRRQQIIGSYIVDFYCEAADLVIELDGFGHLLSVAGDKARDEELRGRGIEVMRIANGEVRANFDAVLKRIGDCARARMKGK